MVERRACFHLIEFQVFLLLGFGVQKAFFFILNDTDAQLFSDDNHVMLDCDEGAVPKPTSTKHF